MNRDLLITKLILNYLDWHTSRLGEKSVLNLSGHALVLVSQVEASAKSPGSNLGQDARHPNFYFNNCFTSHFFSKLVLFTVQEQTGKKLSVVNRCVI